METMCYCCNGSKRSVTAKDKDDEHRKHFNKNYF